MGYRSDVAYTIRFNKEEDYRLFILEAKANGLEECFSDDTAQRFEAECDDKRWRIDFHVTSVKWYEFYPDVQMHKKLIELAREWIDAEKHRAVMDGEDPDTYNPYRIGYAFVRVGESSDDQEEFYGGFAEYDWLYVSRSIERN